ncbi:MAG: hypothetical protein ACTS73_05285 [Arsenophonus sp. NEOnobi-MAG3]
MEKFTLQGICKIKYYLYLFHKLIRNAARQLSLIATFVETELKAMLR